MSKLVFDFNDKKCELEISRVGQEHCLPRKLHEKRKARKYSLHCIFYGYGTLIKNGKEISLTKGNMFLLYENEEQEYFPDPMAPWAYYWIDFIGEGVEKVLAACGFSREKPYIYLGDNANNIYNLFRSLAEEYDGSSLNSLSCMGYTLLLFQNLIQYCNQYEKRFTVKSARFKVFRDILIFINNNYRMNFTLDEIAEKMNVTKKQLITMFNDFADMTPVNYINRFRISTACVILSESSVGIKAVSQMVGIEDEAYFTRMFTKWKGMSPCEYQKAQVCEDPYQWLKEKNLDFC